MKSNQKNLTHVDVIENGLSKKQMSDFELSTLVGGADPCIVQACGAQGCVANEPCAVNGEACAGKAGLVWGR